MSARDRSGWLAAPAVVGTVVLVVVPAIATFVLGFFHYDALRAPEPAGLQNYTRLGGDALFATAIWNSLIFVVMAVPVRLVAAAGTAILFARRRAGVGVGRAATYLPTVVPDVAYALLWLWVFNPLYGPLGAVLRALGAPSGAMLLDPWGARAAIVVLTAFQIGEGFIVALAARRAIPGELYELAAIDGAKPLWVLRRVTLPVMAPVLALLVARDVAISFQANFVPAFVLTDGGPFYATTFLPLYTYQTAFGFFRFGYAAAMTTVMFAVTLAMVGVQALVFRRIARAT